MDINRNHLFLIGLILLFLGIEFRMIDSLVLNQRATRLLAEQANHPVATAGNSINLLTGAEAPLPSITIRPPDWLGWFFLSFGSVLVLQSLTMAKPG